MFFFEVFDEDVSVCGDESSFFVGGDICDYDLFCWVMRELFLCSLDKNVVLRVVSLLDIVD